ncbi:MAG: leucine-rich repeat protein [Oscillospiraceae bacterium]
MNKKRTMSVIGLILSAAMMITVLPLTASAADSRLTTILSKITTSGMTDKEKAEAITKYTAQTYSYNYQYQRYTDLLAGKGGDCWANTDMVAELCNTAGIKNIRHDSSLSGGASGHINNVIYAEGKYYLAEAGFSGTAPRTYSFSEIGDAPYGFYGGNISRYYGFEKDVTIPSEINGEEVTSIGGRAFSTKQLSKFSTNYSNQCFPAWGWDFSCAEHITVPSTVTTIESNAFTYSMLKSMDWPSSVTEIKSGTFNYCENLAYVNIPETVTKIASAFNSCDSLTRITILSKDCEFDDSDGTVIPKSVTICGYSGSTAEKYAASNGNKFVDIEGDGHSHSYSKAWSKDESGHWHICQTCGLKSPVEEHIKDEGTVTVAPTLDKEGEITYSCTVCGYKMGTETIEKLEPKVTVTDGDKINNYVDLKSALNSCKNSSNDIVITLLDDCALTSVTLPTKAKSITFNGTGALDLNTAKLTVPANTIFDVEINGTNATPLAIKVSANKTLDINKPVTNLGAIGGASTATLNVNTDLEAAGAATFKEVNIAEGKVLTSTGNVSSVTALNGTLKLPIAKSTAAITNIGTAKIILPETAGAVAKVTVKDVTDCLTISIVDTEGELITLDSGKTILWAGGTIDFTSKVEIENRTSTDQKLDAFLYSKDIRAEYANAVNVFDGSSDRLFPNLELAFKSMTGITKDYVVTLNENTSAAKITLPSKANSITITSSGDMKTISLTNVTSLSAKVPLTLENVNIESTKPFSLSASKDLTLGSFKSESISAIKGSSKFKLTMGETELRYVSNTKTGEISSPAVSGFGTIDLNAAFKAGKTFTASALNLGASAELTIPSAKSTVSVKTLYGEEGSAVRLETGFTPAKLTGTAADSVTGRIKLVSDSIVSESTVIFAAKNVGENVFDVSEIQPSAIVDYTLAIISGKAYLRPVALDLNGSKYALWTDVVAAVETTKASTADYTIELLDDYSIGGAMKLPKSGTYNSITLTSSDKTLSFTGSVSLTGKLSIVDTNLRAVTSAGSEAKFTLTTGAHDFSAANVDLGLGAVSGTGRTTLENVTVNSTVKAGTLTLNGTDTIMGKITANELNSETGASVTTLYSSKGVLAISKYGITSASADITLRLTDANGTAVEMPAKAVIASTFKGSYNNELKLDAENGSFDIVVSGTKLVLAEQNTAADTQLKDEEASEEAAEETEDTSDDTSDDETEGTSDETSDDEAEGTSDETSDEGTEETPDETSGDEEGSSEDDSGSDESDTKEPIGLCEAT